MTENAELQNLPCATHPKVLTRLRCTECESAICPQCMVMYEVGFKCPHCAKKRPSHLTRVQPSSLIQVGLFALGIGYVYGWLHPWLMSIGILRIFGIPVLSFILAYLIGKSLGGALHRLSQYKIHPALSLCLVLGSAAGIVLAPPFQQAFLSVWEVVFSNAGDSASFGTSSSLYLLGPGLRLLGALFFVRGLYQAFQE